jgi:glycosyltransferase involved in cell wall biosynthesis
VLFDELGIADKVHQRFIEDEQMFTLFRDALVFVFPSIYEGFGLPILDAFSAQCPVILSNCSCFPEVGGDAALYFDEDDTETLRKHILSLSQDESLRRSLGEKGLERSGIFTWESCAGQTAQIYRSVC